MDLHLGDKTAVVTGAGSGIGAAAARRLVKEGVKVLLADRDADAAEAVAAEIADGDVLAARVDVTRDGDVARMLELAIERWGRLDCAVNNAGVAQPAMPIDRLTEQQFDQLMEVNVKGVWLCLRHEIPAMLASGGGAIVNVTSVASHVATRGQGAYAGSKHAALGLTKGPPSTMPQTASGSSPSALVSWTPRWRADSFANPAIPMCWSRSRRHIRSADRRRPRRSRTRSPGRSPSARRS